MINIPSWLLCGKQTDPRVKGPKSYEETGNVNEETLIHSRDIYKTELVGLLLIRYGG